MKALIVLSALLSIAVLGLSIEVFSLSQQMTYLTDSLERLTNTNVPRLTITGKYPYIEAKKGAIIIINDHKSTVN